MLRETKSLGGAAFLLSTRLLLRDWRAGELRVLLLATVVAVACVTAVEFFTDRIASALSSQANELIAADLRLASDHVIADEIKQKAEALGLRLAEAAAFRSMVIAANRSQLVEIKAVSSGYPLRGYLQIAQKPFTAGSRVRIIPSNGEVWVEQRLLGQLQLNIGESLTVGAENFRVNSVVLYEPDRGGDMFSIAPRLMMNLQDLERTKLVQEGSRIRYYLLVAGNKRDVSDFETWLKPRLERGQQLESVKDARKEVRQALDRAQQFLGLAAVVSVVLSCIAISLSARRFAMRHMRYCAVMRCVGATQSYIVRVYLYQLILIGLVASIIGSVLGFASHYALVGVVGRLILVTLPNANIWPVFSGLLISMIGLLGFALPSVLQLRSIPTMQVLRREFRVLEPLAFSSYVLGVCAIGGLVYWHAQESKLALMLVAGLAGTALVLITIANLLVLLLKRVPSNGSIAWRFGVENIVRRKNISITQILAFGVGITVMLLLTVVRSQLLTGWENTIPPDAPNRFIINIQPDQVDSVRQFFRQRGEADIILYPMVRARLEKINDHLVVEQKLSSDRAQRLANREFNLSWVEQLPLDNKIVSGSWWAHGRASQFQFSVEEGIAKTLGIQLGDTLSFSIAGEIVTATVSSLRSVRWDTFKANFFVLSPPGMLESYPTSFITSIYLPEHKTELLNELVMRYPNLTVIDISAILHQVVLIIDRVSVAIEYVFVFTLAAGMMVLLAAIQSTHDERIQENAVLRALGAGKKRLLQGLIAEFITLGVLAGVIGVVTANILGWFLALDVLEVAFEFKPWLWLAGVGGSALIIGGAGVWGTYHILTRPPLRVLSDL